MLNYMRVVYKTLCLAAKKNQLENVCLKYECTPETADIDRREFMVLSSCCLPNVFLPKYFFMLYYMHCRRPKIRFNRFQSKNYTTKILNWKLITDLIKPRVLA